MLLQVGVKIALRNSEGNILFLKRNPGKYPEVANQWDIPGGRINIGVTLLENLKREVKEETGLELSSEPELIAAQDILNSERHVVRLTYVGTASGTIDLSEEHSEYRWFSVKEIKDLPEMDPYFKKVLDKLK